VPNPFPSLPCIRTVAVLAKKTATHTAGAELPSARTIMLFIAELNLESHQGNAILGITTCP
jgi:hypothetical protein